MVKPIKTEKAAATVAEGTVTVDRHYPGAAKGDSKQIAVRTFASPHARVDVMLGVTKNIGDHEFGKISVAVSLPCYPEEIDACKLAASELAQKYLSEEAEQLSPSAEEATDEDEEDEKPAKAAKPSKPAKPAKAAKDEDEDDDAEDDDDDSDDDDADDESDDDEDEEESDDDEDESDDDEDEDEEDEKPAPKKSAKAPAKPAKAAAKDEDEDEDDDEEEESDDEDEAEDEDESGDDAPYTKEQLEEASVDDLKEIYKAWELGKFPTGTPKDQKKIAVKAILKAQSNQ